MNGFPVITRTKKRKKSDGQFLSISTGNELMHETSDNFGFIPAAASSKYNNQDLNSTSHTKSFKLVSEKQGKKPAVESDSKQQLSVKEYRIN